MPYELRQEDIHGLAATLNAETKVKRNELFFKLCPYCHGGGRDKETFSVNLKTGQFKCFRDSCGVQGHFVQMARHFDYPLEFSTGCHRKKYRKLPQGEIEVRDGAIAYLESRGIGRATTERYKITTHKSQPHVLVFPFLDDMGQIQFVKYRNTKFRPDVDKNKEWAERDTMPILFGMWQCVDYGTLVITEGQIDSLSLAECGIPNAVSVPTGAQGFTWLEHCWDWVVRFQEVVVFGDCEKGHITLVDEIAKRLPMKVRVVDMGDYLGEKDANAILQKYGKQPLLDAVQRAKIKPINHIKELADVKAIDIYSLERIKTGLSELDRVIGGLFFGQVILLTGKRGEGKSTFMSQLIVEALDQGYKTLAYSGELADFHFKRWLDFQAAGPHCIVTNINSFGDEAYLLHDDTVEKLNDWYRGQAFIYDNNAIDDDEFEGLLKTIEKAICRYGIRFICIDNLMTAMDVDIRDDIYRAQSSFVRQLKAMAVKYNVAIVLVAHPRKQQQGKSTRGKPDDTDDVAGSGDIMNRIDVAIRYARDPDDDECGRLAVTKNRLLGKLALSDSEIRLWYSKSTKRITSLSSNPEKEYGWSKQTFIEIPETEDLPF